MICLKERDRDDGGRRFPVGKLPMEALARQLIRNRISDRRVLVGPAIGEDAAVIDTGGPNPFHA
jgi:hypothetical protein